MIEIHDEPEVVLRPLRILDLGAHDGFVSVWLRERGLEKGLEVELDGIELMSDAVARARARGINCVRGAAEDAPDLFEPGSYDAVVMFELIEHVPDTDRLLSAAEAMLAPGGQVYVSTPDGTFGMGQNPHHLRVYRASDLADELRRRGRLEGMISGPDGIAVARYRPAERLGDIAIWCGAGWQQWSPIDIETKGLGGSETAATRLAYELSDIGYVVTVYGEVEEGCYRDVIFRYHKTFDPSVHRDAVIVSRQPGVFDWDLNADRKMLWLHDVDCGPELTPERAAKIDDVLVLSKWHRDHVLKSYPFLDDDRAQREYGTMPQVVKIRNGIELSYFTGPELERNPRLVYTSSPDRGLDLILEMWPEVRERVPDAELVYAYSPVYFAIAEQDARVGRHAALIRKLTEQDGVRFLESLPQWGVAKLMRESMAWCAPSWTTVVEEDGKKSGVPFHETYCIGALEAQAAGCVVVASNWGALTETVKVGRLVTPGPPDGDGTPGPQWRKAFLDQIVNALTDEETQHWAQLNGPPSAAGMGWRPVADTVAELITAADRELSTVHSYDEAPLP